MMDDEMINSILKKYNLTCKRIEKLKNGSFSLTVTCILGHKEMGRKFIVDNNCINSPEYFTEFANSVNRLIKNTKF